jgi:eukaryotic-like serine/threonine-protein kinase
MARFWPRRRATATQTTEERVVTPPPRPRPFWPWLVLLLAVVLGALAASWYFASREETVDAARVPGVVGLRQDDAERQIREREFEVEAKRVASSEEVGTVLAQRPSAGTLYGEGGIVVLEVSRDPAEVEVPDVVGLPVARASARLRSAALQPRAQNVASTKPKGRVFRQVPEARAEVARSSTVVLLVSSGPRVANVPDVVGLSTEAATARLSEAGFPTRVDRVPASDPDGTVVAQDPAGGTRARRGRAVRISVSIGRGETTTTVVTTTTQSRAAVPDTVGQDEAAARATLEGAGFTVRATTRTVTDPSQDGIVIQQTPGGGTSARTGSTVTIVVGILR